MKDWTTAKFGDIYPGNVVNVSDPVPGAFRVESVIATHDEKNTIILALNGARPIEGTTETEIEVYR